MEARQITRASAIAGAYENFDSGALLADLRRRVAFRTESQEASGIDALHAYLETEIAPTLSKLGFTSRIVDNPAGKGAPFLIAERWRGGTPSYRAHLRTRRRRSGLRRAMAQRPRSVASHRRRRPLVRPGTADNKGQHSVNFAALGAVTTPRGKLGYNVKLIFETGEEISSPGLEKSAPRKPTHSAPMCSSPPTVRASRQNARRCSSAHAAACRSNFCRFARGRSPSGNWGGVLRNPAVVLVSRARNDWVDRERTNHRGRVRPPPISGRAGSARRIELGRDESSPDIDPAWGEPGLTPTERVIGWNALEVLAISPAMRMRR